MIKDGQLPKESLTLMERKCQLCFHPTFETACLVKSIIKDLNPRLFLEKTEKQKFHIQTQNLKILGGQENQCQQNFKNGFYRLISLVFDPQFAHSKQYRDCKHKQIEKIFISKLNCDDQILDIICDLAVFQIGQRNYQLEILSFQIKTFPKTIQQTVQSRIKMKPDKQNSLNMPNLSYQQSQQMVKFQQSNNQCINKKMKKKNKIITKRQSKRTTKRSNANQQLQQSLIHSQSLNLQNPQNINNQIKIEEMVNQANNENYNRDNIENSSAVINSQQMETFKAQFIAFTQMLPLFYSQHHHY